MKKKQLLTALVALSALWLLGTCSLEGNVPIPRLPSTAVARVSLNKTKLSLPVEGSETLTATVSPSSAINKNVSWSSSAPAIATVSSNGLVTGIAVGNANITVTTDEGSRTATCAVTVNDILANFVRIEGGTFTMGSPSNESYRDSDELQHQVTVSAFYMGKYQVTQAEYQTIMRTNPSYFKGSDFPVEQVSWYDAAEYCNRLSQRDGLTPAYTINGTNVSCNWNANGYRLPTEAEWEYACRAGTTTPFNTGNNITTSQANYNGNEPYNNNDKGINRETTTSVGSFPPNSWGLYDMHGNVWEWCWDLFGSYSSGAQTNPHGPVSGDNRVIRGGAWDSNARSLRSADRYDSKGSYRSFGFRIARGNASDNSGGGTVAVTSVTLNKQSTTITVGNTETLTANVSPSNATNKSVSWSSSNSNVATVTSDGVVTGVSAGSATITVTTADGNRTATCAVTVSAAAPITSAQLAARLASLPVNTTATPHTIAITVSVDSNNDYAVDAQFHEIKEALKGAPNKYVYLDFSRSAIPKIPYSAFSTEVGDDAFTGCNTLIGINMPNTVKEIRHDAFRSCENLASINIPDSVKEIMNTAFRNCTRLAQVTLPNGITYIGWKTFEDCKSLVSINIPNTVTLISYDSFQRCERLASVNIPNGVQYIRDAAFNDCKSLASVTIPNSVTAIGWIAFNGCTSLTSVTFQGTIPSNEFSDAFIGDLRNRFYASNPSSGTPGTYTRASNSSTWRKQ